MKHSPLYILLLCILCTHLTAQEEQNCEDEIQIKTANKLSEFTPKGWDITTVVLGDLDNKPGDEALVVYTLPPFDEEIPECQTRHVAIYKQVKDDWELWFQTDKGFLMTCDGGSKGDPIREVSIKNRVISIEHFTGSSCAYYFTHKYRFQNGDFYLIGANTLYNYNPGEPDTEELDYNLSTDIATYTNQNQGGNPKIDNNGKKANQNNTSTKLKIAPPKWSEVQIFNNKVDFGEGRVCFY